jgi:ATP-dependent helicase/nuclease subunit A
VPCNDTAPLGVAGQVDRLSVTADSVLIADYKTDGVVPQKLKEVPNYVIQLALYRAVLGRIYPGKTVRAALIFTKGPILLEIPGEAMDRALEAELCKVLT